MCNENMQIKLKIDNLISRKKYYKMKRQKNEINELTFQLIKSEINEQIRELQINIKEFDKVEEDDEYDIYEE